MRTLLTKESIQKMEGEADKMVRVRHGTTRLFLRIDRRSAQTSKAFYFEREFRGGKLRMKIGDFPNWSVERAEKKAKELDVCCDNHQDPRTVKQAVIAEANANRVRERAGSVTLKEVWSAYLDARQRDIRPLKPLTIRDYQKHITKTFATWADKPVRRITRDAVVERYRELVPQVGPAQALQAMRSLSAVLNWVIHSEEFPGALQENPVAALKNKTHKVKPRTTSLERGQIAAWWAACDAIHNPVPRAYLRLLLLTGMRREEALSLRWVDVDFRWNTCAIRASKNGDARTIPLTTHAAHLLNDLPRVNEWVFSSRTSASGRMREPAKHVAKIATITGLHIPSHDLRRSFGGLVEWIELPDGAVKQIIGHKPGDVTQAHYKPRPLDLLRNMLQRYEDFILTEAGKTHAPAAASVTPLKRASQ